MPDKKKEQNETQDPFKGKRFKQARTFPGRFGNTFIRRIASGDLSPGDPEKFLTAEELELFKKDAQRKVNGRKKKKKKR